MLAASYFKTALRFLTKNKFFSLINIFCLAVGIAASLMIFQYVQFELSYDKFHEDAENIYRIRQDRYSQGELAEHLATSCNALGHELKPAFPEVTEYTVVGDYELDGIISYGEHNFKMKQAYFASPVFFKLFSYKLIEGDRETVLTEPNTIVINEKLARKFFGDEKAMGKVMEFGNLGKLKVTGVFQDVPVNTHLKFDMLISISTMEKYYGDWVMDSWWIDLTYTYVKLVPGTGADEFETKVNDYVHKRLGGELKKRNQDMKFYLQPLRSIHLYSNYPGEAEVNGDGDTVYFLLIISILILIIAYVNYINISSARSLERAKEVGLRKVTGASKKQLILQFLAESLILNILAAVIAVSLVEILYPYFSDITGLQLNMRIWHDPVFWIIFLLVIISGAILSGLYPAFVLSSFRPITVLHKKTNNRPGHMNIRKALIVFQFVISIILIAGTITIYKQVYHMQDQELGFETDQTMIVDGVLKFDSTWTERQKSFKNELLSNPAIRKVCASYFVPGDEVWYTNGYIRVHNNDNHASRTLSVIHIDHDYMNFYGFDFIAGRNFIEENKNDFLCHILNRKGAELLGFDDPESAIGKELKTPNWKMTKKIIGVIENFHQESPKKEIAPTIFTYFPHPIYAKKYSIKLQTTNVHETIEFIKKKWTEMFPGNTFEYSFLDEHFNEQYNAEVRFGKTFGVFALLAIIIAGFGLFALSMHFAIRRTREIAVRKVHGATIKDIFYLLSKEYMLLLVIAAFISFPVTYIIMNNWLNNFANKIGFGYWFLLFPLLVLLIIIIISVSYQLDKAARINPAEALKFE